MMICTCCGKEIDEKDFTVAFQLPDVVWALTENERNERAKYDKDLCCLDDSRYFIRGVAKVPVVEAEHYFEWGLWAEVEKDVFNRYWEIFDEDAFDEPHALGFAANLPSSYQSSNKQQLEIIFGSSTERPKFKFLESNGLFFIEQSQGISSKRLHDLAEKKW